MAVRVIDIETTGTSSPGSPLVKARSPCARADSSPARFWLHSAIFSWLRTGSHMTRHARSRSAVAAVGKRRRSSETASSPDLPASYKRQSSLAMATFFSTCWACQGRGATSVMSFPRMLLPRFGGGSRRSTDLEERACLDSVCEVSPQPRVVPVIMLAT